LVLSAKPRFGILIGFPIHSSRWADHRTWARVFLADRRPGIQRIRKRASEGGEDIHAAATIHHAPLPAMTIRVIAEEASTSADQQPGAMAIQVLASGHAGVRIFP
jgi:hypothetical protein